MSGSVVNRGGVHFEFLSNVEDEKIRWRARMRQHSGMGATVEDAADDLVAEIEKELRVAKAGRATLRQGEPHG